MQKFKFDLDKALAGAQLITRDGRAVVGFRRREMNSGNVKEYPYVANILSSDGKSPIEVYDATYTADGNFLINKEHNKDLFMKENSIMFSPGDVVEVSDDNIRWSKATYLASFNGFHLCTRRIYQQAIKTIFTTPIGINVELQSWRHIRPEQKVALTMDQIAEKFNVPVDNIKIVK